MIWKYFNSSQDSTRNLISTLAEVLQFNCISLLIKPLYQKVIFLFILVINYWNYWKGEELNFMRQWWINHFQVEMIQIV